MGRREDLVTFYERYLAVCNRHAFAELRDFIHDEIRVNGRITTALQYVDDLRALGLAFPDYCWTLRHTVIEDPWLSVRLQTDGTHVGSWLGRPGTGKRVGTHELAIYRIDGGRIAEVWATADNARLLEL